MLKYCAIAGFALSMIVGSAGASHAGTIVGLGGRCVTAVGGPVNGKVVTNACTPSNPDQQWTRNGSTSQFLHGRYCLDILNRITIPGTLVTLQHCNKDSVTQKWFPSGDEIRGHYNVCLNVAFEREGEPLNIWGCNRSAHQKWFFRSSPAK